MFELSGINENLKGKQAKKEQEGRRELTPAQSTPKLTENPPPRSHKIKKQWNKWWKI